MKLILLLCLAALLLLIGQSCDEVHTTNHDYLSISGTVLDANDSIPIDSVEIILGSSNSGPTWYTDSLGKFNVPGIADANSYFFKKNNYQLKNIIFDINNDTSGIEVYFEK